VRPPGEQVLSPLWPHLEACAPKEGCALLWRGPDGERLQLMRNAAPAVAARTGFQLDEAEWLSASLRAERGGERLAWIIHSHVDRAPWLSGEDRAAASLHPGVGWLVVSLLGRHADACALYPSPGDSRVSGGLEPG